MVHRKIEEALQLRRVEVQRQHALIPRLGDEVGHQLCRDRRAALVLAVLPPVPEVRDHRRDPLGRRAPQRIRVDQHLHQVVIHRLAGRQHHEAVPAAHILLERHEQFAVREDLRAPLRDGHPEKLADPLGQQPAVAPGEDLELPVVRVVGFARSPRARRFHRRRARGLGSAHRPTPAAPPQPPAPHPHGAIRPRRITSTSASCSGVLIDSTSSRSPAPSSSAGTSVT